MLWPRQRYFHDNPCMNTVSRWFLRPRFSPVRISVLPQLQRLTQRLVQALAQLLVQALVLVVIPLTTLPTDCHADPNSLLEAMSRAATNPQAYAELAERLPPQQIAARRQPDRFKLVRAWRAGEVARPGNVVCFDTSDGSRIVALDGWRTVAVLDHNGQEITRHELDLPRDAAIGFLRTAVDASGTRWWLGGHHGGQQVFVFDAAWRLHAAYPDSKSPRHAGIRTAFLEDLNDDGAPELTVACYGSIGMEAASLDGRRLWQEHSVGTVLDAVPGIPVEGRARGIVYADVRGRLAPVTMMQGGANPLRASEPTLDQLQQRWNACPPIHSLFGGPVAPNGGWAFLGLASPNIGKNRAVGLGPAAEHCWEFDLPDGVHRDGPIEPVAWADLLGTPRRQWLIAAPDGSVTVAWADGGVVDRYRHGAPLVGIGGYRNDNEGIIVIATRDSLEGYRVDDVALD
jgi:hypothetical protein